MEFPLESIQNMIYVIRGQRVMLDSDLAILYGVETKRINEQVKRNRERFPCDFMFQLCKEEYEVLKSQIATSKKGSGGKQKMPYVFTENGVAMLSSVLRSKRAIEVNITIMRTFTRLRSFLAMENSSEGTEKLFKIVFERLDDLEDRITPNLSPKRRKIGLKNE